MCLPKTRTPYCFEERLLILTPPCQDCADSKRLMPCTHNPVNLVGEHSELDLPVLTQVTSNKQSVAFGPDTFWEPFGPSCKKCAKRFKRNLSICRSCAAALPFMFNCDPTQEEIEWRIQLDRHERNRKRRIFSWFSLGIGLLAFATWGLLLAWH